MVNTFIKKTTIFQSKTNNQMIITEEKKYQGIIRLIIFFIIEIRVNISFTTLIVSYFAPNLTNTLIK